VAPFQTGKAAASDGQPVEVPSSHLRECVVRARDELVALEGDVQSLLDLRDAQARARQKVKGRMAIRRFATAIGTLALTLIASVAVGGWILGIVCFPLALGAVIVLLRLDHAVGAVDKFAAWVHRKHEADSLGMGRLRKLFLGGSAAIGDRSRGIGHPYLRAGVNATVLLYYWGALGAAVPLGVYLLARMVVWVGVCGLIALILWVPIIYGCAKLVIWAVRKMR